MFQRHSEKQYKNVQGPERAHIAKAFAALKLVSATVLAADAQVNSSQPCAGNKTGCISFIYSADGHKAEFQETVETGPGGHPFGAPNVTLFLDGKLLFGSADVASGQGPHIWTINPEKLQWTAWKDPVIVSSTDELAAPSPPYTAWKGSALGCALQSILRRKIDLKKSSK